jgi:type III secretory pathway component EscR
MNFSLSSLFIITTLAGLVPLLLTTLTSYVKTSIVLSIMRGAFGGTQIPSQALIGVLSLLVSMIVMAPVLSSIQGNISDERIRRITTQRIQDSFNDLQEIFSPWMSFLRLNQGGGERTLLSTVLTKNSQEKKLTAYQDVLVTITAFILSELKKGFYAALVLLLPFLIIDIVCAQILTAVGLTLLTPTIISLPLKLLLFIQVDGWLLLTRGLISSYL